jgi:imidazolonepropionase-like amidohydrolase
MSKRLQTAAAIAAVCGLGLSQAPPASLVITGARIYTAPDAAPIEDGVIVIEGDTIAAVGPRDAVKAPGAQRTIDAAGLVVTAGFQNNHVHFSHPRWSNSAAQRADVLTTQLKDMLGRYGFTSAVDAGSDVVNTLTLRRRMVSGQIMGPRILTAGSALYPPNGIPYQLRAESPPSIIKLMPQPLVPDEAAAIVQRLAMFGAAVLKVYTGSLVERGKVVTMSDAVAAGAVAEARRHGLVVYAHTSNVAGLDVALRAGFDVLAHAIEDTRGFTDDHRAQLHAQKVALIPTLKLLSTGESRSDVVDQVRSFAKGGGQILFGTDAGYLHDADPTGEYELMASAGLDWRQILASMTTNPAERFGEANRGRIAKGMIADLAVLGTDPAAGVKAFADVRYTVRDGRVIYSSSPPPQ